MTPRNAMAAPPRTATHQVYFTINVAEHKISAEVCLVTDDTAAALQTLDTIYDQARWRLAKLAAPLTSWPYRFGVNRQLGTADATTECVGMSKPDGDLFTEHRIRHALDTMDRGWIRHREHIARFAAQGAP